MKRKCDIRIFLYNGDGKCIVDRDSCEMMDWKLKNTAEEPTQYGDEDEPMLRCPSCKEDVTDLMDCGFNFCPYCGKRWYVK